MPTSAQPARTASYRPTRDRAVTIAVVAGLLILPLGLGLALGWYGLDGPLEEMTGPVGSMAHELLDGFPDSKLVVEISAPPGELPASSSVSVLWERMNETLSKESITFQLETYSPAPPGPYSLDDLASLEDRVRSSWPEIGTMSLFYLFVDGSYAGGSSVLGLAHAPSSIAVFPNVVSGGASASIVSTVLVHEFGHEIGLVGVVGPAPNEDLSHPGHSDDPNDVMYWQVETTAVLGGLLGGASPPTQFDAADLSDLATVRSTPIAQELIPWIVAGVVGVSAVAVVLVYRRARRRDARIPRNP